jgi:hypothetical protein
MGSAAAHLRFLSVLHVRVPDGAAAASTASGSAVWGRLKGNDGRGTQP